MGNCGFLLEEKTQGVHTPKLQWTVTHKESTLWPSECWHNTEGLGQKATQELQTWIRVLPVRSAGSMVAYPSLLVSLTCQATEE